MLSIGLLGAGRIGTLHGRNVAAHAGATLDGLAAQRLADAATEAARSGRPQRL